MTDMLPELSPKITMPEPIDRGLPLPTGPVPDPRPVDDMYDGLQPPKQRDPQQPPPVQKRPTAPVPKAVEGLVNPPNDPVVKPKVVPAQPEDQTQFKKTPDVVAGDRPNVKPDTITSQHGWGHTINEWDKAASRAMIHTSVDMMAGAIVLPTGLMHQAAAPQAKVEKSLTSVIEHSLIDEKDDAQRKLNLQNLHNAMPMLFPNAHDRETANRLIEDAYQDPAAWPELKKSVYAQVNPMNDLGWQFLGDTRKWADTTFRPSPEFAGSFQEKIAGGLGSVLVFAAASTFGGSALGYSAGALASSGNAFEEALRDGTDPDTAYKVALLSTIPGATDNVPFENLLRNPKLTNVLFAFMLQVGKKALEEGGQEAVQQVMQNQIKQYFYKPKQQLSEGVWDNFLVGAVTGGAVHTLLTGWEMRDQFFSKKQTQDLDKRYADWISQGNDPAAFNPGDPPPASKGTPADLNAQPLPPSVRGQLQPDKQPPLPADRAKEKADIKRPAGPAQASPEPMTDVPPPSKAAPAPGTAPPAPRPTTALKADQGQVPAPGGPKIDLPVVPGWPLVEPPQ